MCKSVTNYMPMTNLLFLQTKHMIWIFVARAIFVHVVNVSGVNDVLCVLFLLHSHILQMTNICRFLNGLVYVS